MVVARGEQRQRRPWLNLTTDCHNAVSFIQPLVASIARTGPPLPGLVPENGTRRVGGPLPAHGIFGMLSNSPNVWSKEIQLKLFHLVCEIEEAILDPLDAGLTYSKSFITKKAGKPCEGMFFVFAGEIRAQDAVECQERYQHNACCHQPGRGFQVSKIYNTTVRSHWTLISHQQAPRFTMH